MGRWFILSHALSLALWCGIMQADDARVEQILSQMTLKEKIDYIGGKDSFYIRGISRLHLPEISIADGTCGVRKDSPTIGYPAGINIAASWNVPLAFEVGQMMGSDARARGVHILLAPAINLCRAPMCGRNFEYLGEDPYLTSRMAVSLINGIQSQNVAACVKHFAANNQEWNRNQVSSDIDERTLRELYLPAFEAAVREARVACVMAGYNLVNGTHMTQHKHLNLDILKKEWGFSGILMSDWSATHDGIESANNGLDLEMPFGSCMNRETLFAAIQHGKVDVATIDDKVRRILRTLVTYGFLDTPQTDYRDSLFNHRGRIIAQKMAQESMVLLKNEGILPLNPAKIGSIAVIGPLALKLTPHGGGSSEVSPNQSLSYIGALSDGVDTGTALYYAKGVPEFTSPRFTTTPEGKETGLMAQYYDNSELKGAPALTRIDQAIKFQFKERSYRSGGPINHYSARWTGYFTAEKTGDHTLYLSGNDGYRLFLNDIPLINHWDATKTSLQYKTVPMQEGAQYKLCIEYHVAHGPQAIEFGLSFGKNRAIDLAKEAAASAEVAIVCAGFDQEFEGEDWDRSFYLPLGQDELIQAVASVNPNTIVVMSAGGNVHMGSWIRDIKALLYAWYPGQEGAKALANTLFGKVSPSGKLPVSFEKELKDNAAISSYYDKDNTKRVPYTEGILLGYRHHDTNSIEPLFPFGFGLSYSSFSYSNITVTQEPVTVSFDITNTGPMSAHEVAQVYVSAPQGKVLRPLKELKGFTKIALEPNQTQRVTIPLEPRAFCYYDAATNSWEYESGTFNILVGSSSKDICLKQSIEL